LQQPASLNEENIWKYRTGSYFLEAYINTNNQFQ